MKDQDDYTRSRLAKAIRQQIARSVGQNQAKRNLSKLLSKGSMMTKLFATAAVAALMTTPAMAAGLLDSHDTNQNQGQQQGQGQGQIAIGQGGRGGNAHSSATSGAVAGSVSGSRSGASADNANPQSTNVDGDHYDGSFGFGYSDAPMPSSPVVSPGAINLPQHTETYKVLGPIFGHSYTGGPECANSGAMAAAMIYRDLWLQTVALYGVTAAAPAQAEYAKTVERVGVVCANGN